MFLQVDVVAEGRKREEKMVQMTARLSGMLLDQDFHQFVDLNQQRSMQETLASTRPMTDFVVVVISCVAGVEQVRMDGLVLAAPVTRVHRPIEIDSLAHQALGFHCGYMVRISFH